MAKYTLSDIARAAGLGTLPEGGAWVCITGCPIWPRNQRIIPAHREIGIRHLDIYWGAKEAFNFNPNVNRYRRRRRPIIEQLYYDMALGADEETAFNRAVDEYRQAFHGQPHHANSMQASLVTISHPHSEEVRFYNSEVRVLTFELIRELLAVDWIETITFGQAQIPVLEDAVAEIADAMQLDGMSREEARHEILTAGIIEPNEADFTPQWFYRPRQDSPMFERFCEEA